MRQNRRQLGFGFEAPLGELTEAELKVAHHHAGLKQPFDKAMDNPALAICLQRLAQALKKGVTR